MALVWDKTLFDQMYAGKLWRHGVRFTNRIPRLHYHYIAQKYRLQHEVEMLLTQPGFAQVSHVAIVGGGFGWTAEIFGQYGIEAISVDTSDYVLNNQSISEEAEIRQHLIEQNFDPDNMFICMDPVDPNREIPSGELWSHLLHPSGGRTSIPVEAADLSQNADRRKIRQRLSNKLDGILSEYLLDGVETEAEALSVAENCEQLRPNPSVPVIHLVSGVPEGDPRLQNKTIGQWRALLDANGFSQHYLTDSSGDVA